MQGKLRAGRTHIIDERGHPVRLWGRSATITTIGLLDQMTIWREQRWNVVRLLFDHASVESSGLDALDHLIASAENHSIRVILARTHAPNGLWFTDACSEERWIDDWRMLAQRYRDREGVIGADLHHRPGGNAAWFHANPHRNWSGAARRCGNAILQANPDWLIFVQGVEQTPIDRRHSPGGNLAQAGDHPVRLNIDQRLVYAACETPSAGVPIVRAWDDFWGYLPAKALVPILPIVDAEPTPVWREMFLAYLHRHQLGCIWGTFESSKDEHIPVPG